ncbi:putative sugar nucleotidyl transferase [Sediminitomix flava]|uniref:UDP-N-acetylglucosamine diphosphorylase/glucosamine-1-phosphate N-acetyltransferase n=1 Tax=Sediminitomix flava TaxID=379075 RepID=A0A315ZJ56_SEDFL|nr:putative sugar nucleotidyl transferase [Sediminitomix flava]PWJ33689.1 UDP-N-acetylglucosamine diphosphorylase/glucosamine-1-phosphate N-acetyltransferase [Sediminitomix flava]
MNILIWDNPEHREDLMPFTFIRPIGEIRIGILKVSDKWRKAFPENTISYLAHDYLQVKYKPEFGTDNLYINGIVCPNPELNEAISQLQHEQTLVFEDVIIATRSSKVYKTPEEVEIKEKVEFSPKEAPTLLRHKWDIFLQNGKEIEADFPIVTAGRQTQHIRDPHTVIYGQGNIFIEEGAQIKASIINAEDGPVYIGKNALIREGCILHGPIAICEGVQINMGAKIREDCTFGPYCKIGGEIGNSVFFGYSNKVHEGYVGNTVVGKWCNFGADSNTSNLKNNYGNVKVWNYKSDSLELSDQLFCGTMMGDYARCGINTMLNTGTVVGVCANIFGAGFPPKHVPPFAWGGFENSEVAELDKMYQVAERVKSRRNSSFTDADKEIFTHVFELSKKYHQA